ncbi:MAG: hypothetical protein OXU35_11620, partial [Acidobacteriota bacterium]|nr:hypothetical protein [Acidobacteriota bacterium]
MSRRGAEHREAGIPAMEVLRIRDIRLHEEVDLARVAALIERLGSDGILRNPPIVARLAGGRRLLLDGANRIEALRRMGMQHALVQTETFGDDALGLTHWNHVIRAREAALILEAPPAATGFQRPGESRGPESEPLCRLWSPAGEATALVGPPGPAERAAALRELCTRYTHPRARL